MDDLAIARRPAVVPFAPMGRPAMVAPIVMAGEFPVMVVGAAAVEFSAVVFGGTAMIDFTVGPGALVLLKAPLVAVAALFDMLAGALLLKDFLRLVEGFVLAAFAVVGVGQGQAGDNQGQYGY
jgi:hypothetical protein